MLETMLLCCCMGALKLPEGASPKPLESAHFPSRAHAFVWRNWSLVSPERLAATLGTEPETVRELGRSMGLREPRPVSEDQWRRSYITIIRRNWHLLPYEQLLDLLGWSEEELAFCLREDDFLFVKLGRLKPACERLRYVPPTEAQTERAKAIARVVEEAFPKGLGRSEEPLFGFLEDLTASFQRPEEQAAKSAFSPRYCYSYFALYGDPLLEPSLDPYPDPYLERLSACGVNGVWLQAVLYRLVPFPWDPSLSEGHETRRQNLKALVSRARARNIGVYLYLNEPRAMPLSFFENRPEVKGVTEGDYAALCTSCPAVQEYLTEGVRRVAEAVPELAGFFTITASENLTSCWSHHRGKDCPRCAERGPAEVIAEVNALFRKGIERAGTGAELIAWDWGWGDDWAPEAIRALPKDVCLMSVSEWSIPVERGGVRSVVGEYSISEVGPGPRAKRHWKVAGEKGLKTLAKIQANNTWELSSVPYVPAVRNVAMHAARLRQAGVKGLMLGWTLGGHPSPNLEVVAEMGRIPAPTMDEALRTVAKRRAGQKMAPVLVSYWTRCSEAFSEYPYHIGTMYNGPQQMGPANPLYASPTGYHATMVGLPYDDLNSWRSVYPADVFVQQFEKMGKGFQAAVEELETAWKPVWDELSEAQRENLRQESRIGRACAVHFQSVAHQGRFVLLRDRLLSEETQGAEKEELVQSLRDLLEREIEAARTLYGLQTQDSRLGFEASNQYFYVPLDLAEKIVLCRYLLETWLPEAP